MYVSMKEILLKAQAGGYAVAAPNVFEENTIRAVIEAAEELKAPIIVGMPYRGNDYDLRLHARMVIDLAQEATVPVALNQDHGMDYESGIKCIQAGFSSIMADRSSLPFEENIAKVKELVKVAHACGVTVEAELGHVGMNDKFNGQDDLSELTEPDMAAEFVERTGCDCLAISIGTAHGLYKKPPKLNFEILGKIRETVSVPLVLHGGSSTGDENLARACREGISKVNLSTDLDKAGIQMNLDNPPPVGRYDTMKNFKAGYKAMLIHYMELFGQCGKAWQGERFFN